MNERLKSASRWPAAMPGSRRRRAHRHRSRLMLLPLAALLSACTRSIVMIPDAQTCSDYVPASLWQPTTPAPLPADDTAGAWVAFANSQAGRLQEAGEKPAAIRHILTTCEARAAAAIARAQRDSLPWWQRIFG